MPIRIYEYTDYRRYLKDWFEERKGRPSARAFAKKVECSPALLSSVMSATRDLSPQLAEKITEALGLGAEEKAYFLNLVDWNQGATAKVRREALGRVMVTRRFHDARRIVDAMYRVFSEWYYPVILELVACEGFREDPDWIASTLLPPITREQAAEALTVLVEAGFLAREPDGRLHSVNTTWATEHEVRDMAGAALHNLHRWLLARGAEALDEFRGDQRHFATISLAVPPGRLPELKQTIGRFEEELLSRFGANEGPDTVYQCSIQLFPLTKPTRTR